MEFHWTRTRLIKAYKSFDLSTNKINEDCRSFLHKNQGPVATRRDGLGTDHVTVNRLFDRTTWTVDYRTKKCCSKPSALWETPIYASLLMCFRLLNSTKKMKKSKNYFKRQKAIIRLVYEMMKLWSMIFNFHGYMCTVPYNCQSKTKNRSAKTNTHGKTKAILLLLWSIWFCREVFGQCCREIFCFCREVFGFAVTVVGPIFILDLWTP